MLSKKLIRKNKNCLFSIGKRFFGGGGHKKYDWRDDSNCNVYYNFPANHVGHEGIVHSAPYIGEKPEYSLVPNEGHDVTNPNVNFSPDTYNKNFYFYPPAMEVELEDNIAHEVDYGSEDADYQPEDFSTQHFHRQMYILHWIIVANMFLIYTGVELLYQHYPDHLHYRKPHPFYKGYPEEELDEYDDIAMHDEAVIQRMVDDGKAQRPQWGIKNGKWEFGRFAGVNNPQEPI